jgi:hypothetical protein
VPPANRLGVEVSKILALSSMDGVMGRHSLRRYRSLPILPRIGEVRTAQPVPRIVGNGGVFGTFRIQSVTAAVIAVAGGTHAKYG